jgi:hypothetical protein
MPFLNEARSDSEKNHGGPEALDKRLPDRAGNPQSILPGYAAEIGTFFVNMIFAFLPPNPVQHRLSALSPGAGTFRHPLRKRIPAADSDRKRRSALLRERPRDPASEKLLPDYDGLLINLCEPVITNALGLTLLGEDPRSLQIADEHRETLLDLLRPLPRLKRKAALEHAAEQLCRSLQIRDPAAKEYLSRIADGVCPRLSSAIKAGDLSCLFPSLC